MDEARKDAMRPQSRARRPVIAGAVVAACAAFAGADSGGAREAATERTAPAVVSAGETGWSNIERMGSGQAGKVGTVASVTLGARRVVTAVRNGAGKLQVIVWELQYDGSVKRLGSGLGGVTPAVKVAAITDRRFVTAAQTEAGGLKLTVWDVSAAGEVQRRGSGETGEIKGGFAVAALPTSEVVTAVRDAKERLKLISWGVHPLLGLVVRRKSVVGEEVGQVALATYDSYPSDTGRIATAVTTKAGNLKVIAWSLGGKGELTRLGDAEAGEAKEVAASGLSHRRIVTAVRNGQNRLEVLTWDFDAAGKVSLHASGEAGTIGTLDVATMSAARVVTSVRDGGGRLTLIVWDAVDDVVRLGHERAGATGLVSLAPLGSDWLVTPVRTAAGTLKVIAWREHAVALLRGEWSPQTVRARPAVRAVLDERAKRVPALPRSDRHREPTPVDASPGDAVPREADGNAESSPAWSARFEPGVEGIDPMIAVGFDYVVVTQDHRIGFFDKKMNPLGAPITPTEFFATFLEGKRAGGSRNEHSINRHLGFPAKGALDKYPPGSSVHCDPDAPWPESPVCIDEFFDTRVHFDPASRRFFIVAAARPVKKVNGVNVSKSGNPLARRYWALAVSRSEDPRAGFHQWMTTEAHWFDYPRITVEGGVMVMHSPAVRETLGVQPVGMKPQMFLLAVDDLLTGTPYPRSHKLFPPQFDASVTSSYPEEGFNVVPLVHHGNTGNRLFFLRARAAEKEIEVFSFKRPSDWRSFPPIEKTKAAVGVEVKSPAHAGTFRDGRIYLTWVKKHTSPVAGKKLHSIRLLRVPVTAFDPKPTISTKASDGFLYRNFGTNAPEDDPGDLVSYEVPDLTVTKDGHIVIVYGRAGVKTKNPLFPEARYSVYYADSRGLRRSRLLKAGEYLPGQSPSDYLDYETAVVDPADDRTVWMISVFPDKADAGETADEYRTVVGTVLP